ncbi:CopK family periplasmic copper-binding protein [Paucibacter sp. O1-1]|nr:CopK family periplasmic copper-binding protein [Paucibacter sp. O1-1]MDA3824756.1 CopK family periplasmic copper-binding protein [Paucibacter sp. O1-1]
MDGKMAKEDAYGCAVMIRPGEVIAARDGRRDRRGRQRSGPTGLSAARGPWRLTRRYGFAAIGCKELARPEPFGVGLFASWCAQILKSSNETCASATPSLRSILRVALSIAGGPQR